jgi:phosphoribosylformylglycinamidine synthase
MKMAFGNGIGFKGAEGVAAQYAPAYGQIIAELTEEIEGAELIGWTTDDGFVTYGAESVAIDELYSLNTAVLEKVYPTKTKETEKEIPAFSAEGAVIGAPAIKCAKPKVLIPVFPGTNCEYDSARAVMAAGGEAEIVVVRNLTAEDVVRSVETVAGKIADSQMIFIPGGFSGGDEPDGSAKFITAFFRNPAIKEQVTKLLDERDGLMCGICNGFQALIKLGLVPYGKIIDTDANCPTLTFNTIGRHQSRIVRTRIASNKSPWLSLMNVGDVVNVAISHGEGRFFASEELALELAKNGQIATQYVDLKNEPTMDTAFNPNGSLFAIEGITSPDGRVFGKMGHSERIGKDLYRNVPGEYDIRMFEAAVKYFKG